MEILIVISFGKEQESVSTAHGHISPLIVPIILAKLMRTIFEDNQTVTIGKVDFDKNGYHTSKIFKRKSALWKNVEYQAKISYDQGKVLLFESEMYQPFTTVRLKEPNAHVIPVLVESCSKEYHIRNPQ